MKMVTREEEASSKEEEYTEITTNTEFLQASTVYHVIKDTLAFVLYMHQQIPSVLQDMCIEHDALQTEIKELELDLNQAELTAPLRRKNMSRKREVKHEIRKHDKLMKTIASVDTALQLMISEMPNIQKVILILGGSTLRPQHVYELFFSEGKNTHENAADFTKTRAAQGLSRKAIRTLISKDAGSISYPGPTKLFLLVNAPSSFNLPLHFLPKRDFRFSKKIVPFRLRFNCRTQGIGIHRQVHVSQSAGLMDSRSNDLIWFQCRHVIKGLEFQTPTEE